MTTYHLPTAVAPTLATTPPVVENAVELIGEVFASHRNRKWNERGQPIARPGDTKESAAMQRLRLQITELNGTLTVIPLAITRTTAHAALLLDLLNGDRVRVTGLLTHEDTYDGRFITPDTPQGRPTREVRVRVLSLARVDAGDEDGSFVQLRGEITEPPAIRTHPTLANLRIVHCKLRVVSRIPDRRGGELVERHVLPVDVPLDLADAEAAMVRGNVIAVQGLLDVVTTEITGDAFIDERVTEVREDWSMQSTELEAAEHLAAGRQVARTLRTLSTERSLRLRATKVTLITGERGELRETQRTRTAHVRQLRSGGRPLRRLSSTESEVAPPEQVTLAAPSEPADGGTSTAVTTTRRYRRQGRSTGPTGVSTSTRLADVDPQQTVGGRAWEQDTAVLIEGDPEGQDQVGIIDTDNLRVR